MGIIWTDVRRRDDLLAEYVPENTPFMQVCHSSDRLSAVFGSNTDRDVSVPYLLEDDNFDAEKVFRAVKAVTPKCLWMSTSENSPVESSSWLMNAAADWQVHNDQYFVLAINYKSKVWEHFHIQELLSQPYVFHTTVNMRSYEKWNDENDVKHCV